MHHTSVPTLFYARFVCQRRYLDADQGWHLEASGPIIEVDPTRRKEDGGPVIRSIRHNDLDRIGFLPPLTVKEEDVEGWYERIDDALDKWDNIVHNSGRVKVSSRK